MFAHKEFSEHFFRMTEAEYLAYEAASEVRHEYVVKSGMNMWAIGWSAWPGFRHSTTISIRI